MIVFRIRQGMGLDIEYSKDICHVIQDEDGKERLLAFNGLILKLPFCQIYYGDAEYISIMENKE